MKKILAFGASNSSTSINQRFATWVAKGIDDTETHIVELNEYEMPIYSPDIENNTGFPESAVKLKETLDGADAYVISLAEYNGNFTPVFKNTQDWLSRMDRKIWGNKPVFLLSTSPGKGGASSVMSFARTSFPHMGAEVVASFSLPEFYTNFNQEQGITDANLSEAFQQALQLFIDRLK